MSGIYVNPNTKFVGIGTIAPTSRLQVDGNAHFGSNADTDAHTIIGSASVTCSNATGALIVNQQGTGKIFELQNSGTARMTVLDGGNVGIGIANPTQKLYVVGDTRIEGNLTVNGTQTVINTDVITTEQLLVTNNGTGPALVVNQTGAQPVIDIQDDGVSVLKIINNGNIGMGTTDPTQRLHVQGSILATTQHLGPAADTSNAPGFSWSGDSNTGIYRPAADAVGVVTGGVERMRVLANGNVGIGTTNPQATIHIQGDITATGSIKENGNQTLNIGQSGVVVKSAFLQSGTARTYTNVLGGSIYDPVLSITYTPKYADSDIVIQFSMTAYYSHGSATILYGHPILYKGASIIYEGATAEYVAGPLTEISYRASSIYLDVPNTTSPITYSLMWRHDGPQTGTLILNRNNGKGFFSILETRR